MLNPKGDNCDTCEIPTHRVFDDFNPALVGSVVICNFPLVGSGSSFAVTALPSSKAAIRSRHDVSETKPFCHKFFQKQRCAAPARGREWTRGIKSYLRSRCGGVSRPLLAMSLKRWLEQCCLCQVSFWEVCCLLPPNGQNTQRHTAQCLLRRSIRRTGSIDLLE